MPRVKIIKTLTELCVECISVNFKTEKCVMTLVDEPQSDSLFLTNSEINSNIFSQLPTVLSEEIINSLRKLGKPVEKTFLKHHTLTAQLKTLRLNPFYQEYLDSFSSFGKLEILNLSHTEAGDSCLQIIGIHCKNLRILNVAGCCKVTDTGIEWLCVSNDQLLGKSGQCKRIQKLNVCYTNVSKGGIETAFRHLPALRILIHTFNIFQFEVMIELAQMALDHNRTCAPFSLAFLRVSGTFLSKCSISSLELALSLCSSLVKIDIVIEKGLKNIDLLCLKSLKMLRDLNFFRHKGEEREDIEITFDGDLVKLLKEIGKSLEKLGLSCFDVVDISTVIEYCPNLIFLSVNYSRDSHIRDFSVEEKNRFRIEWRKEKKLTLKNLTHLKCGYNIPSDVLLRLLSFPSLVDISLINCDALIDDVLHSVVKRNGLQNLTQFMLLCCDSVTNQGIDALMKDSIPLSSISLYFCKRLTVQNVKDWHVLACRQNWELFLLIQEADTNFFAKYHA